MMSMTKCPDCRRLSFVAAESCQNCGRAFGPAELRAQANDEEMSLGKKVNGAFAALFLSALTAAAFVMPRGAQS